MAAGFQHFQKDPWQQCSLANITMNSILSGLAQKNFTPCPWRTKRQEVGERALVALRIFLSGGFLGPWSSLGSSASGQQSSGKQLRGSPAWHPRACLEVVGFTVAHVCQANVSLYGHTSFQRRLGNVVQLKPRRKGNGFGKQLVGPHTRGPA